jgi:hypothetical protein
MMPTAVAVIWIVTLVIIAAIIVPVAVSLLRRVLNAAWAIEAYMADMKTSGVQIAGHTGAIPALDDTLAKAAAMIPVAENIKGKTGAVATLLSERAIRRAST